MNFGRRHELVDEVEKVLDGMEKELREKGHLEANQKIERGTFGVISALFVIGALREPPKNLGVDCAPVDLLQIDRLPDQGLFDSIKRDGLKMPITLDQKNRILDGERRAACFKLLDIDRIPCIWTHMTDEQYEEHQLIKCVRYVETDPATYRKHLLRLCGHMTIPETAAKFNWSIGKTIGILLRR